MGIRLALCGQRFGRLGVRQVDIEGSASAEFRLDRNEALVTFDDAVTDRQPKTSPVYALGGIERFEHALAYFFLHAGSGVSKTQPQSIAVAVTANVETAALGHGVHGVDDQIHKYLTQLRGISESKQTVVGIQSHVNIRAFGAGFVLPTSARDLDGI